MEKEDELDMTGRLSEGRKLKQSCNMCSKAVGLKVNGNSDLHIERVSDNSRNNKIWVALLDGEVLKRTSLMEAEKAKRWCLRRSTTLF